MRPIASAPTPGWYPDPWEPARLRWWDGEWTGHTADPPSLPDLGSPGPREWTPWIAPVALLCALLGTAVAGIPLFLAFEDEDLVLVYAGSAIQYGAFAAAAIGFARMRRRARITDFGFRRPHGWGAVGWAALAMFTFWLCAGIYGAIVAPDEEAAPLDDLGLEEGRVFVWLAAALVIVAAPVFEEFFFRGFFYPALRARWRVGWAAAVTGIVFGAMHVFNGPVFIPPLMLFGAILCLLYERTRSLYPGIALHVLQNTLAFGVAAEEPVPALVLGGAMMTAVLVASVISPPGEPAAA